MLCEWISFRASREVAFQSFRCDTLRRGWVGAEYVQKHEKLPYLHGTASISLGRGGE